MHCVFLYLRTAASDNETSASQKVSQRESHLAPLAPASLSPVMRQLTASPMLAEAVKLRAERWLGR